MVHLINKDALVAEIERLHKVHSGKYGCDEVGLNLEYLEDFIDTLEVKEVDLIKEVANWKIDHQVYGMDETWCDFAEYFYKLGLKAQKGK